MNTSPHSTHFIDLAAVGLVLASLAMAPAAQPAFGHHAGAAWDREQVQELQGTIKEFQFTNPHTWIQLNVENADGTVEEWSIEWGSPNSLSRRGIRPSTFPPGVEATMRINPMKSGDKAGGFVGAKFGDGTVVGRWED